MRPRPLILLPTILALATASPDSPSSPRSILSSLGVGDIDVATLKAAAQTAKSCNKLAKLTAIESLAANETALAAIAGDDPGDAAEIRADAARKGPELAALRAQAGGSLPQTCDTLKSEAACVAVRALQTAKDKAAGAAGNGTAGVMDAVVGMAGVDMQALMSTCQGNGNGIVSAQAANGMGASERVPIPSQAWILSFLGVTLLGAMML